LRKYFMRSLLQCTQVRPVALGARTWRFFLAAL